VSENDCDLDLRVGSSKWTWVDLGLRSGVKSVCSSVTVEIFWRSRSHYKSFQVDLTNNLARSIVLYPHFHSSGAVSDYSVS